MSYARNLLSRGEEVVFESRQHWFAVLALTWVWIIVAVLAFAILVWTTTGTDGAGIFGILQIASLLALLAAALFIGLKIWAWRNQEYLVTNRRVIKAEGIFNKTMRDSSLEKVNDAHLSQSWLGRIFDYGTLDILTAADEGSSAIDDFPMLADPVKFKIAMLNMKEQLENRDLAPPPAMRPTPPPPMQRAEPMPPRAGSDRVVEVRPEGMPAAAPAASAPSSAPSGASVHPADQLAATLESLAGLRDKGLITPEEYEAKKREILERM
ncbi:MAG TPA: PH domain-containing protein [candidate division Zixibacteria bacterium]|nr:PH domain-containing protein [candidate division Zixibacteria bacterium]